MNALTQLYTEKQSFWLDYIRRDLMTSGTLKKMIEEEGLRGMTSNPTIFMKALESGDQYDAALRKYGKGNLADEAVFELIAVEDIQKAADVLKPVFKSSRGKDGFVSLEVNPNLAYNADETFKEAIKLSKKCKRQNLMIKIPGTLEGLPAVENTIAHGVNVNVTLLFSVEGYKKVLDSYLNGLEKRVRKGLSIKNINSVASFFVSRVDSVVDKKLDAIIAEGGAKGRVAQNVLHKAAIANAKLAYDHFQKVIQSPRWKKLEKKGANVQRLLWASTGTKDNRLSDVVYVEELIGPETVNTMPPATAEAFKKHGKTEPKLLQGLSEAKKDLATLKELGINLEAVTQQLQDVGVQLFIQSFNDLIRVVGGKREALLRHMAGKFKFSMGSLENDFQKNLSRIEKEDWLKRIWNKDAALWKKEEAHQKIIENSLGWLTVPDVVHSQLSMLEEIKKSVKKGKFTHCLLLGMGGSSLCPEVLRLTFGKKAGFPDFSILDSTEPASVWERRSRSKPEKTLYIVASKSGSTTEPNAFLSYFYEQVKKVKGARAGENFIAITDPGTIMETIAKEKNFRHIVLNPSDIGGRFSALSFFGMVPAALMGIDVRLLLQKARKMSGACYFTNSSGKNPGAYLGAAMGTAAQAGRNKITFSLSKDIGSFGAWAEQLIAESTGKENVGIVPIESEELQDPPAYANDRIFVAIRTKNDKDKKSLSKLKALEKAGFPVFWIQISDKYDITGEFFRWEIATAVAGKILDINPFDQPNVQDAKDLTIKFISDYKVQGGFPHISPSLQDDTLQLFASNGEGAAPSLEGIVKEFLNQAGAEDYVALLAFITRNTQNDSILQDIRHAILKAKKVATSVGFGPRYLHSTGQLHKGGDNHGLFLTITATDEKDFPVPGEGISFSILKEAQGRGDWQALKNKNRRVLHIHLKKLTPGLHKLKQIFETALRS